MPEPYLLIPDACGIYIPKNFANIFAERVFKITGVEAETWGILEAGPDHEHYWEAWEEVERDAVVTGLNGQEYFVHHINDCWLIPKGMEWDEKTEWWKWPAKED